MLETHVLDCLIGVLKGEDEDVQQSSMKALTALAKFGRLIFHFVLCDLEDLMIHQTISA